MPPSATKGKARRRPAAAVKPEQPRAGLRDLGPGELVALCRAGDEAAWSELLARFANLIYSIPLRRGLGRDAAEEIFQSVSTTLLERLHLIDDPARLPKWLMVTTSRRTSAHVARSYRTTELTAVHEGTTRDNPESLAVDAELRRNVEAALADLPERDRELLADLFDRELPYIEIAARHRVAVGSLGSLRARALGRLRRILEHKGAL